MNLIYIYNNDMTTKKDENFRIYLKALLALRKIIKDDYANGGWLPPERIMSERLGTSRVTYRKLVSWLVEESLVCSSARRGHWVVEESRRCAKIGIVIGNGCESPFLGKGDFLTKTLTTLKKYHYSAHLIQSRRMDNIYISAMSHAVNGLIWLSPPLEAIEHIKNIDNTNALPLILVMEKFECQKELKDITFVAMDFALAAKEAAKYLIKNGHSCAAFLSSCDENCNSGFAKVFHQLKIPFEQKQIITGENNIEAQLHDLFQKKNISVIMSDGSWERLDHLFRFCMELPVNKRPKLIIPEQFKSSQDKYHELDIIAYQSFTGSTLTELSEIAVDKMIDHLKTGKKMKSALFQAYKIEEKI